MLQCIIQPRNGVIHNSAEMRGVFPDIRVQLNDQLRCLDSRVESQQSQLVDMQDIFKRRAEIEMTYSRDLEKLAKLVTMRHKEQKQKRESWSTFSSTEVWLQMVENTRKVGRDHAALAEILGTDIPNRCSNISEDLGRIYRQCRDIGFEIHEEVLKALHELHTAMKTHQAYQQQFRQAESKLAIVEKQRTKLKETIPEEKLEKSRKFRLIEKEVAKRTTKYKESRLKATKARTEYLLYMESANSSIHKYFVDDLSDLIDCMDFGFHQSLTRAMKMHNSAVEQIRRSSQQEIDAMNKVLSSMDSRLDKKKFLEMNEQAFMLPKKFEYQPVRRDESELVQKPVIEELASRQKKLAERISCLRKESEDIWRGLETTETALLEIVSCVDYDTSKYFTGDTTTLSEAAEGIAREQQVDRLETEQIYLARFREYILNSNRISRLQAKYDNICQSLGERTTPAHTAQSCPATVTRRRIGRTIPVGQHKLFGGALDEYLEASKQDIPLIVKSCVRVINLYGLHHQGIFRVSGSKVEINNFREAFERGEDPLADVTDASDINSVAGVLKLYLRELREPVFSIQYFDQFMELAKLESKHEFVVKVVGVVATWPRPIFTVMRYIFAFLNHLSEYSDENMMDPYNLAICFGPTLVTIPPDRDQVIHQNMVNELIKNFIIFHEDIFPNDGHGTVYEKYFSSEPEFVREYDIEEENTFEDETDCEPELTDEESEILEAHAQYDFTARSSREVSFCAGASISLYSQVSSDWWRGCVGGREGLIPDKYILLKIRGDEELKDIHQDRRRSASHTDTLRSTRSENVPSNTHRSLDPSICYPITSSLQRGSPHRHSISHTPPTTASTTSSPCHLVSSTAMLSNNTGHTQQGSQQEEREDTCSHDQSIQHNSTGLNTASTSIEKQPPVTPAIDNLGARPKTSQLQPDTTAKDLKNQESVLLKQSSWGSRIRPREKKPVEGNFARNRELWEKRSSRGGSALSDYEDDYDSDSDGDEQERRNKPRERNRKKLTVNIREKTANQDTHPGPVMQTPDLVLDIPPGALADSPTVPPNRISRGSRSPSSDSLLSTASESSQSLTVAETFASVSDTIRKINTESSLIPPTAPQSEVIPIRSPRPKTPQPTLYDSSQALMSTSSTFKPVLKDNPVKKTKETEEPDDDKQ